jgi:hypothetical protein
MEFYYWTEAGQGIDIRSPTRRLIIDSDVIPTFGSDRARQRWRDRCDISRLAFQEQRSSHPTGAEWRGVTLCNTAGLLDNDLDRAVRYFRSRIDEDYKRMYWDMALDAFLYVLGGLGIWLAMVGVWNVWHWIRAGHPQT